MVLMLRGSGDNTIEAPCSDCYIIKKAVSVTDALECRGPFYNCTVISEGALKLSGTSYNSYTNSSLQVTGTIINTSIQNYTFKNTTFNKLFTDITGAYSTSGTNQESYSFTAISSINDSIQSPTGITISADLLFQSYTYYFRTSLDGNPRLEKVVGI